jgi:hypothetical protein
VSQGETLDELALKHGADKSSEQHGFTAVYERFLEPLRELPITMLEIGVFEGASVRMWRDYFPHARIYAIDFDASACRHSDARITVLVGNQMDPEFLDTVAATSGPLDFVVDDGGHRPEQQLTSLFHLWEHLKLGGVYAIEDVHTSYLGRWSPGWRQPGTAIEVLKDLVDDVNSYWHQRGARLPDVESVQFYPELCVISKRPAWKAVRQGDPTQNEFLMLPDERYPDSTGAWSGRITRPPDARATP